MKRTTISIVVVLALVLAVVPFVRAAPSNPAAEINPAYPADAEDLLGYCDATFDNITGCYYEFNWSIDGSPYASGVLVNGTVSVSSSGTGVHSCGVLVNGSVLCWGSGSTGQLGYGGTDQLNSSVLVNSSSLFSSVSVGAEVAGAHSCASLVNGSVLCWGLGSNGRLGYGGTAQQNNPVLVNSSLLYSSVSVGSAHSCGLLVNGSVLCWGLGTSGRLGYGGTADQLSPVLVNSSSLFSSIDAGSQHSCGVLVNGSVLCWGSGGARQLGYGGTSNQLSPVLVNSSSLFSSVSANSLHSCGVLTNGSVLCWGSGTNGKLGTGNTANQASPVLVNSSSLFSSVAAGGTHTCGVLANGSVLCWGAGSSGQLGYGGVSQQNDPVQVNSSALFSYVSAGSASSCGVLTNGSVLCWGAGSLGQLGYGGTSQQDNPIQMDSLSLFSFASCEDALVSTIPASDTTLGENWTISCRASSASGSSSWIESAIVQIGSISPLLSCLFTAGTSCSSGFTKLFGVENDTGGYENAHVQNATVSTYANSVCCNSTDLSITTACGTTLLRLESSTGGHVEQSNESNAGYADVACLDAGTDTEECQYEDASCSSGYECVLSFANANGDANDATNAHVGTCGTYTRQLCCRVVLVNSAPPVPTLLLPIDYANLTERYPTFNWTNVTDPDGDPVTYQWNLTSPSGCAAIPVKNTSNSYYTSTDKLCVDNTYNWTVRACDDQNACSAWATQFNFTIPSVVGLVFTNNSIDFGTIQPSTASTTVTNNTLTDNPVPLVYNNTGNVDISTSVFANASLWSLQPLSTLYQQYADENSSAWENLTSGYQSLAANVTLAQLRELEVKIQVPVAEPPGLKRIDVTVLGASIE